MRFINDAILGFRSIFGAIRFIIQHKFYWYMIIPAILMLFIYGLGARILESSIEPTANNMNDITWFMLYLLIEISVAILMMKFAKYLVIAILSPLISVLSTKTERILTGKKYPFSFRQLIHDIKRAYRIIVRNLMWEYTFFIIIFIVSYFGWEDPLHSPVFYLTFVIGFYYYGFGFLDYILERRKMDLDESILFVRKHRGLAVVIGLIYSVMILVPVDIGALFNWSGFSNDPLLFLGRFALHFFLWILASAAPIVAIVTATISMHELIDLNTEPKQRI